MAYGKAIKWSANHTDKYMYSHENEYWVLVECSLTDMDCTAPSTLTSDEMSEYKHKSYNCRCEMLY